MIHFRRPERVRRRRADHGRGPGPCAILAALLALAAGCASVPERAPPIDAMQAAERGFAAMSVAEGMRAAFSANFAPEGLVFWPAPIRLHDAFAQQPPPSDPRATTLDWAPVAAGMARSGDFGFSTGPWTSTDNRGTRAPVHGVFFSVWRHTALYGWKVVADAGAPTPEPVPASLLLPGPRVGPTGVAEPGALLARERIPAITATGYASWFADDAMLLREGMMPVRNAGAIAAKLGEGDAPWRFTPTDAVVASTGDLGYSYGAFASGTRGGYYLHLWTRDAQGRWRVAVAVIVDDRS